ncbi:hypothetical protein [Streptomyces sp. NPDC059015]|uniref:hypothetical protein n=1 Tax=unclassified Streptomyces TaxID=2593676 RepID=UPI00369D3D7D
MAERTGGKAPRLQRTDFEAMTHQQLAALLASASPTGASNLATKLALASSAVTKIGEDLKKYVTNLPWHGEGGDAFRNWGGQTASATLRLGEYSKGAARWMEEISQAIAEAKAAMPPITETTNAQADLRKAQEAKAFAEAPSHRMDTDAGGTAKRAASDAAAAQGRIDAARWEAAQRLRKLAQTYEFTAQQVNAVTPPTFPPPAMYLEGNTWRDPGRQQDLAGQDGARTGGAGAPPENPAASYVNSGSTALQQSGQPGTAATAAARERPVHMEIDGLATLPAAPPSSPATPTGTMPPGGRPDAGGMPPGVLPPAFGGGTVKPSSPPVPPVNGRPSAGGVRPPVLPGLGQPGSGGAGRLPRDSGIVGGRPVPPSAESPARGIPRGMVIGGEGTSTRGPMGYNPTAGAGAGGARPGPAPGGRRYASETGGIVGGSSPQQAGRQGYRPFTPGGTGLVSGTPTGAGAHGAAGAGHGGSAVPPPGQNRSSHRRGERGSSRPDYLAEDEETRKQNGRRIVPPVID